MQITVNGEPRDVADRLTVAELLLQLDLRPRQVAVEVSRVIVPRSRHDCHALLPNDSIEIVTLVGGG